MQLRKEELELRRLYELEREKYEKIEQKHEQYAKIRHDFNNQLAAAHILAENQNREEARRILEEMREKIAEVSEN